MKVSYALLLVAALLVSACASKRVRDTGQTVDLPLADVVTALQTAINNVAADDTIWESTRVEHQHHKTECEGKAASAQFDCMPFTERVMQRCRSMCKGGVCNALEDARCKDLSEGKDLFVECLDGNENRPAWCDTVSRSPPAGGACIGTNLDQSSKDFCEAARICLKSRGEAESSCGRAKKTRLVMLKSARANLEIADTAKNGADFKVIVFSAGASSAATQTQTIELNLVPRPKLDQAAYKFSKSIKEAAAPSVAVDGKSAQLSTALAASIKEAIKSVSRESVLGTGRIQNPMLLTSATIRLVLSVTKTGQVGLGKEGPESAWKIGFSHSSESKAANTIEIIFSQADG